MVEEKEDTGQEPNLIEQAKEVAERIEKANKEAIEVMERYERNRVIDNLSGKSEAGIPTKEESPEEIKKKGALSMFAGSEIEDALKKYG